MGWREYVLTEELVRWRLEILLKSSDRWWIAFANPIAGPWKRLMGRNGDRIGEVHRFQRDSDRPDLVAVNDLSQQVLIIEAKDQVAKLLIPAQIEKTSAVITQVAAALAHQKKHPYWGNRAEYEPIAGLLWGRPSGTRPVPPRSVTELYGAKLGGMSVVAFETEQHRDGTLSSRQCDGSAPKLAL